MTAIGDAIGKALGSLPMSSLARLHVWRPVRLLVTSMVRTCPVCQSAKGRRPSVTKALSLLTFRTSREVFDWKRWFNPDW
ncbi:hypothetical protein [Enterobacter phage 01_vB_Eclo_IJM]|nr:hypothetical protein [Enterobacter phage 01_vB_Eclo_IJM]